MAALKRAVRTKVLFRIGILSFTGDLYSAVSEDDEGGLNMLCQHEGHAPSKVKRKYLCPICTADSGFDRGQPVGDGFVIVPADVIAASKTAVGEAGKTVDLSVFRTDEVQAAMPSGKSYYVGAEGGNRETYVNLLAFLSKRRDLAVIGEFAMRDGNATLYQLVAADTTLILRQLARPDLVRERPSVEGEVSEAMVELIERFATTKLSVFDPTSYVSKRTQVIAEYVASQTPVPAAGAPVAATVETSHTNLADALTAAIAAAASDTEVVKAKRAPRKRAAKKVTAPTTA